MKEEIHKTNKQTRLLGQPTTSSSVGDPSCLA